MRILSVRILVLLLTALLPVRAQQPATGRRPLGVPAEATLFNGKWYHVFLTHGGWKLAREKCVRLRGQLAIVPDEATQAFIRDLAKNLHLWLGATDEKTEGRWLWVDGTEMNFTAWAKWQPDNGRGRENYLELWGGSWNDSAQDIPNNVGFICEWPEK